MRKKLKAHLLISSFVVVIVVLLCSWGVWGHEHINRAAIFALPEEMGLFYYNHMDYITEEAVGPDQRKYTLNFKSEGPRHFIDIEAFDKPIDSLPKYPKEASAMYEESVLTKNGSLPWYIQEVMAKLTKAFSEKRKSEILLLSADLGHYLGDAHMPLHTALNHDGQLTNQVGIHSFWESQLPELFGDTYNLNTGKAKYIEDVSKETWRIISSSHQLEDTLLAIDRNLTAGFAEDKKYKKDDKGKLLKNKFNQTIHTEEYARQYHAASNGMVEKQLRGAITATADFWYTAWVNGGKPDLTKLDDEELTKQNHKFFQEDRKAWEKGKVTKLKIDYEF
ncbi:MAG: Nuclease [Bacteroidota bacterium]|nr:Nuclease [Bacteroidota bacterium]